MGREDMNRREERTLGNADLLFNLAMQRIDELQLEGQRSRSIRDARKVKTFR
jgi:hypothetical protein